MTNIFRDFLDKIMTRHFDYKFTFKKNNINNFDPIKFMNLRNLQSEKYRYSVFDNIKHEKISNILDFGANYGYDANVFNSIFPKSKIHLYDIDEDIMFYLSRINKIFFDDKLNLLSKKELDQFFKKDKFFDLIYTNAVLMYLDEKTVKKLLNQFLKISKKYIVLHELDKDEANQHLSTPYYTHDFDKIFKSINPKLKIKKIKTSKPGFPWQSFGYIFIISKSK